MKLRRALYEGPAFWGVSRIGASLKKVRVIVHGARGDGYGACLLPSGERALYPNLVCSTIRSQEIFSGALPRLLETVLRTQRQHPDGVVIIAEASFANLLKEDISSIIQKLSKKRSEKILIAPIQPFRDSEFSAAEKTLAYLVRKFSDSVPRSPDPSVNIISSPLSGFLARQDLEEIKQVLDDLEIEINLIFPLGVPIHDLKRAGRAWFNISLCPEISFSTLRFMEERHSQPYILFPPVGLEATGDFINSIGRIVDRDYGSYISRKNQESNLIWFTEVMVPEVRRSKTILIFGGLSHTIGVTKTLAGEFGFRVVLAGTYLTSWQDRFNKELKGFAGETLITDDSRVVADAIKRHHPDLVLGTLNEQRVAAGLGIPFDYVGSPERYPGSAPLVSVYSTFIGYGGINNIIELLTRLLSSGVERDSSSLFAAAKRQLDWTEDAQEYLRKIPAAIRGKVSEWVEAVAMDRKYLKVNLDIFHKAKEHLREGGG